MKLRILYKKVGMMKYISHLELLKTMERSFRRANLPLAYSQGYNPRPQMAYAMPLPVGVASHGEVMEVVLTEEIDLEKLLKEQGAYFPPGIDLLKAAFVEEKKSLMSLVAAARYLITCPVAYDYMTLLRKEEIIFRKRNKKGRYTEIDMKKRLLEYTYHPKEMVLEIVATAGSQENLQPRQIVKYLAEEAGLDPDDFEILRTHLYTRKNERLKEIF